MPEQQNPSLDDLLAKAHSIGEDAASQADQAEKNCRLSNKIVEDINKARLIQVLQPKRFGGLEMGFPAMVRISQPWRNMIWRHPGSTACLLFITGGVRW